MKPIALIVEDSEPIARIWQECLEEIGMDTRVCGTLAEAKILARRIPPPDLLLLDLRLTDSFVPLKTVEGINELKANNPNMVVLVISGLITPEVAKVAIEKGAHAVIEKQALQTQKDLWMRIEEALKLAPPKAKDAMAYASSLIAKLTHSIYKPS